jgi:hypothetical protein
MVQLTVAPDLPEFATARLGLCVTRNDFDRARVRVGWPIHSTTVAVTAACSQGQHQAGSGGAV